MLESILGGANVIGNISFGVRGCIFFLLDTTLLLMLTKDAKSTCGWQIFLRDGICRVSRHKMLCNMTSRRVLARCSSLPSLFVLSTNEHCLQATSRTFALELYQKGDGKIDAVALEPSLWRPRAL